MLKMLFGKNIRKGPDRITATINDAVLESQMASDNLKSTIRAMLERNDELRMVPKHAIIKKNKR